MIILHSVDRSENRFRAYTISLEPTLFGEIALETRWGRFHSQGQQRIYHCEIIDEVLEKVGEILNMRRKYGCEIVASRGEISVLPEEEGGDF